LFQFLSQSMSCL